MSPRARVVAALCAVAATLTATGASAQAPTLSDLFSDHAVLQRDRPIPVWGQGRPGGRLTVSLGEARVAVTVNEDGRWRARLPARGAGGPLTLTVSDGDGGEDVARDVMVGDVWLCSGQSNMELPVNRALNAPAVIGASSDERLRLLTVAKDYDAHVQADFRNPVAWAPAGPDSVAEFSAACFFFAQELRRDHDVPMGLINASWGGSRIEAWMSRDALVRQGAGEGVAALDRLSDDPMAAQRLWGEQWQAWWAGRSGDAPWSPEDGGDWRPVPAMTPWEGWGVPELAAYNGMVWYRVDVELTQAQARAANRLSLGAIDEADQTWVNGVAVGASGSGERVYDLPEGLLRAGRNTVVVNVLDTWQAGGLYGPADRRALLTAGGEAIPLDPGGWRWRRATVGETPPRAPWSSTSGLTTIGNAMIAPLHDYGMRGALWYQGESNTGEAERYRDLLTGLMADWRDQFDAPELPFLVVQLANFGAPNHEPRPSGWAELRESQRLAVDADPHAALAVAIDLGDRWDIHPAQKEELGRRLARAARHAVYGEDIPPSGPAPAGVTRQGRNLRVAFGDVTGELRSHGGAQVIGFELCAADACRYVAAVARGSAVELTVPDGFRPDEIRFCWADNPTCNLFDDAGLPAGPFRLRLS